MPSPRQSLIDERHSFSVAVIGGGMAGICAAIADLGWLKVAGYPAWLLWLFIHLMYLVGYDNRLIVFIQWAWNYFTRKRAARLITYKVNSGNFS